jgi:CheY-like chemotaxis protein
MQAFEKTLAERPDVLLLDWLMPRMNGTQVCRLLRAHGSLPDLYVVFVTSRGRREELVECLNAGADDLLVKPVAPDVLVARLELARHRIPGRDATIDRMRQALAVAAKHGDGEFVVRSIDQSARVFFEAGRITWIEFADGSGTFLQELSSDLQLDADTVSGIVDECKHTANKLTDVLVAWGVVDDERLRERLRMWLSKKLDAVVHLPQARSLFLPQRRADAADTQASSGVAFDLEELGADSARLDTLEAMHAAGAQAEAALTTGAPTLIPVSGWNNAFVFAPNAVASIDAILDRCVADDGVLGVVALERTSGFCLGSRGIELNADAAWAHIQCLNTVMRLGNVQDSIVTTDQHFHLARLLPGHTDTFVYAVVDASSGPLAMARLKLQHAAQGS